MRGAPGCGKSTWLKNFGLTDYALSADALRLLMQSPVMDHNNGTFQISQRNDRFVWDLLFQMLEKRMERGELCIVDACHSKSQDFAKYKKLIEKYRYRLYCIDFSSIPLNVCLMQNMNRPEYKRVPEVVVENIYSRFRNQDVPGYCKVIDYGDVSSIKSLLKEWKPMDADQYKKVVVVGDIHGCYDPLKKWFDEHPFSEENLYVFIGDYIDRGLENDKVVEWLLQHYDRKNVVLLEGNHERWLREYADEEYDDEIRAGKRDKCKSSEFFDYTSKQLEKFKKKDLRNVCRKFSAVCYLKFRDKKFFITHAGVGFVPPSVMQVAASEFIKSNEYESDVDAQFEAHLTDTDVYQIHGHRNSQKHEIQVTPHSFNLCGDCEFGGDLRILEIEE
jgi:predicted kinase/predicted phosphodiesterase